MNSEHQPALWKRISCTIAAAALFVLKPRLYCDGFRVLAIHI